MASKTAYPWFFFSRIARLALVVFLPTLFLILFLYRSSYKQGLTSQMTVQTEADLKLLQYTLGQSKIQWERWCNSIPSLKDVQYTLVQKNGTIICDSTDKKLVGEKLDNISEIVQSHKDLFASELRKSDLFGTQAIFASLRLDDDLMIRKVIPMSSLKDNMDRFDRVLFLRIVPFAIASYLLFVYLFYLSTKPLGIILSKVEKFKDDIPFNKNLQLLYERNEWSAIEEALNKADQKLQRQMAEARSENEKNNAILESINDDIIAIDKYESVLFYNTKFKNDFLQTNENTQIKAKLWHTFNDEVVLEAFRSVLQTGSPSSLRARNFPQSHRPERFFDLTITPLKSSDGSIGGALGVFYDVTEFKLSEQMRVDFVANVSHEIRTPLTSVKGYTQLLQAQSDKIDQSLHIFLDKIVGNTERMISLFNDLLNLSVIESRYLQTMEPLDLPSMVETVASNIKTNYPQKRVEVSADLQVETITGDMRLMEQVLTNLVDNACKYSDSDNIDIKVASFKKDSKALITITDNGPGISKEHIQRIFERFYRVDSSREVSRGTGLGLSIVKHIIAKHKGRIWAESAGKGTTFIIELPLE